MLLFHILGPNKTDSSNVIWRQCTSNVHALVALDDSFVSILYSSSGGCINCSIIVEDVTKFTNKALSLADCQLP